MSTAVEHSVHPPPAEPLQAEPLPDIPASEVSRQALLKAIDDPAVRDQILSHAKYYAQRWDLEAEDLAAEVYRRVLDNSSRFDPNRHPIAWMIRFVPNIAKETVRSRNREPLSISDPEVLRASRIIGQEDLSETHVQELRRICERCVDQLPDELKEICQMRYQKNMDYPEIARNLRITKVNARKKVSRAVKQLRLMAQRELEEVGS